MDNSEKYTYEHIIREMPNGVMMIGFDGRIKISNPNASVMLGYGEDALNNRTIAELMSESLDNDDFFEVILDAVYTNEKVCKNLPYFTGSCCKYYSVNSDILTLNGEKLGIIITISDHTEEVDLFIKNKRLANLVMNMMNSFVEVIITAVEEKSPYNANHTKSMARYIDRYLEWLRENGELKEHTSEDTAPLLMSVWLHDMGKLLVPHEVMDKSTRLGKRLKDVLHRIETAQLMLRIKALESPESMVFKEEQEKLSDAKELIISANNAGHLTDDIVAKLRAAADIRCLNADGEELPLLEPQELEAITVVRGTLTDAERRIVESHVSLTKKLLSKMEFRGEYKNVPLWAGEHHELLDGSGYPEGLSGNDIPWETRLLTIIDIYDALTADDRPYKPPVPPNKAFEILRSMSREGKIDGSILESFFTSNVWK